MQLLLVMMIVGMLDLPNYLCVSLNYSSLSDSNISQISRVTDLPIVWLDRFVYTTAKAMVHFHKPGIQNGQMDLQVMWLRV
jgi:hypothetical protein